LNVTPEQWFRPICNTVAATGRVSIFLICSRRQKQENTTTTSTMPKNSNKRKRLSALLVEGKAQQQQKQQATVEMSETAKRHGKQNAKSSREDNNDEATQDWLDSLVQQCSSGKDTKILSKEERITKRQDKKAKREQFHMQHKRRQEIGRIEGVANTIDSKIASTVRSPMELSKRRLQLIASSIDKVRQELYENTGIRPRLYDTKVAAKTILAARTKNRKRFWSNDSIQPRPSDYGGIGLARNSLYIEFLDPSCLARLEEEFHQHIPGFFGKQWTKAMKRQTNGNMLWRQLADNKHQLLSKKMKSMSPDQRVQALMDSGMI
jgi:hypothetical protein